MKKAIALMLVLLCVCTMVFAGGSKESSGGKTQIVFWHRTNDDFTKEVAAFEAANPDIDVVIHFGAYSLVPESMKKPLKYFDNNVAGLIKLLEVMKEVGVNKLVFSSSAATYGIPDKMPIKETDPQNPINPYGESKLMMEKIMHWADEAYGMKFEPDQI